MKIDRHIHSPFCPHGSSDSFEKYVEQAIKLNFESITFTEHAPLPPSFTDPTPEKDSAMAIKDIERYLDELQKLKKEYRNDIDILIGLEVDYIEEYEQETTNFLNMYGPFLDDSILSVHFLKKNNHYFCLDFSADTFSEMIQTFGSIDAIYTDYYQTVKQSILTDLGPYKPKRIGHITLVRKFQKQFHPEDDTEHIKQILQEIKRADLQLDYNSAGLRKPLCGEPYPSKDIVKTAVQMGIPLIYGSDAHCAADLGKDYEDLAKSMRA